MRKQITKNRIPDKRIDLNNTRPSLNGRSAPNIRQRFQSRYDNDMYFRAMIDMAAIMAMALCALFVFYTIMTGHGSA